PGRRTRHRGASADHRGRTGGRRPHRLVPRAPRRPRGRPRPAGPAVRDDVVRRGVRRHGRGPGEAGGRRHLVTGHRRRPAPHPGIPQRQPRRQPLIPPAPAAWLWEGPDRGDLPKRWPVPGVRHGGGARVAVIAGHLTGRRFRAGPPVRLAARHRPPPSPEPACWARGAGAPAGRCGCETVRRTWSGARRTVSDGADGQPRDRTSYRTGITPEPVPPTFCMAALDRSRQRPLTNGPRSLMRTVTERPVFVLVTWTLEPIGSVLCAAVRASGLKGSPLAVICPCQ